jgi:hypothetical protein
MNAEIVGDTIRLQPKEKKTFVRNYPYQPVVIKTSPTAFLAGGVFPFTSEYRLMLEMTGSRKQSDELGISYLGKNVFLDPILRASGYGDVVFKVNGYRLQYAHKFYLVSRRGYAPYGFFVGPLISYANAKVSIGLNRYYKNVYYEFNHLNANIMIGVQTGKYTKLATEIYFGLGYRNNIVRYHYHNNTTIPIDTKDFGKLYNSHINAVFGLNVGIGR